VTALDNAPSYAATLADLQRQFRAIPADQRVRLAKRTSNLFRARDDAPVAGLDVAALDGVLSIDRTHRTADVLGMTTYEHLTAATLPFGLVPLCVPQLRTITLGGAVTGMGIEAASFRNGCPHESVLELDVLTGTGEVITATGASNDPHRDLFYGFPNSYGSLGYSTRLRIELEEAAPYVSLRHVRFNSAAAIADAMAEVTATHEWNGQHVDYCDGTVFTDREHYLTLGRYDASPPPGRLPSDYTGMQIYYRSIRERCEDLLTTHDYLWRWDTDWFWCSRAFGAQNPRLRRLWPKSKLRSDVYWKMVALDRRLNVSGRLATVKRQPQREPVVQDIEVPVSALPEFLDFFHREVGIEPIWLCPLKQRDPSVAWPLYEFDPATTYVNVGFWSTVPRPDGGDTADGRINRLVEQKVTDLGGRKSLYSTSYYERDTFADLYGGAVYEGLKAQYDPDQRFAGMYEKCVGRS
jgi:FAD/FMN-containing dehydrogenase